MSGITYVREFRKVYILWLTISQDIRNDSGNNHVVWSGKVTLSPIELPKCCYQFCPLIALNNIVVSTFPRSIKSWGQLFEINDVVS